MMMEPVQGPRFCKTHVSASCSETVAEKPPAAQPLQRLPCILFPPWEVIIALALERRACFLSPPLLCGGRSSACSEHKGPVQEGGGIMLYTIQSLLYCCCGLPSLNWGGAPFFKVGKLLARQRRLHLPKSLDENVKGERVCVCLCVVCERAELNYNLTFLSSGLCSVKEQLIQRVCAPENISDKACPQTQKSVYGNISTRFPQSNSQTHHSPAEGGDKSRRWETRSVSVTECWNGPRRCSLSRSRNEKHRCIYPGNQCLRPQLQLPEDPWNTGRWFTQLRQVWRNFF